ncbi:uncharacterized protein F4822DRAFT_40624 [Hypoxylon trugodes]|uniref:uncharacterized protein n=1 Tax=Hypoxylon trugodes TaxID=326681 RepID=UPI00218F2114|nr:uncharacterized protein F4822DRAFT_40624 [Hypoxylon trugodes]KAI1394200.1 hypothetical protein F4822DRAFT_40624 [Hypoxylon trugodes]
MPATHRQKACIACADSKRRCDKQLPECQRCLDRDMYCVYPQPKRRRRDPPVSDGQVGDLPNLQNYAGVDALGSELDLGDWGVIGAGDLDVSLSDMVVPYMPIAPSSTTNTSSTQGVTPESVNLPNPSCPWFLRDETWIMQQNLKDTGSVTSVALEPFIQAVEEMLQSWVKDGHNSFIHRRLYEDGMPTCLQDAFTTLSAYINRTPAVKGTILQIAEERSLALASQTPPTVTGTKGIRAHLARTQALFIYEFIRLFDGSVRMRASAERQLPILRRFLTQMWDAAKRFSESDAILPQRPFQWGISELDREYDSVSELWHLWILSESVRRTHLVVDTVFNIYQIMTRGWTDCPGAAMFTARRGLWETESAVRWGELCYANSTPLLVAALQPEVLMAQHSAGEFDDFATMYWSYVVGPDKMRCWIDKGSTMEKTVG